MKAIFANTLSVTVIAISLISVSPFRVSGQNTAKLHRKSVLIDTHNDFLSQSVEKGYVFDQPLKGKTHSDLGRMDEAGLDIQIFSVWCDARPDAFAFANREIDTLYAIVNRNPGKLKLIYTPADLDYVVKKKMHGAMIGVEGGHMIEDDLSKLDSLYKRGTRYMTLTWNNSTAMGQFSNGRNQWKHTAG